MKHSGNMGSIGKVASASNPQKNIREKPAPAAGVGNERKADPMGAGLTGNMGEAVGHLERQGSSEHYMVRK